MQLSLQRTIAILAVIGVGLAFVNFFLVSRFSDNHEELLRANGSKGLPFLFSNIGMYFSHLDIDPLAEYKIQPSFITSTLHKGTQDVVLITHCTANHLHYLLDLVDHWKGPISVAIVVPGLEIVEAYKSMIGLHLCNKEINERVTFHIAYPLSHPALDNKLSNYIRHARQELPVTCEEFMVGLQSKHEGKNYGGEIPYPNNLLRNIAREHSTAEFVFMVDIDMMCNGNLYGDFLQYARKHNLFTNPKEEKVFVVPAFESQDNLPPTTNKSELMRLWKTGKVQPFYFNACWKCQRPTNYDEWKVHQSSSSDLEVSHTVEWKDPWEPFYIGPRNIPLYDERFKQYGFNRITQVCETHIAGFSFAVLDKAFLVHHGFKFKEKFHKKKDEENNKNRQLFRQFKKELKTKYPKSDRRC